jgi:hypothetical protein
LVAALAALTPSQVVGMYQERWSDKLLHWELKSGPGLGKHQGSGDKDRSEKSLGIWDTTALITWAKLPTGGRLVLDYVLQAGQMVLASESQRESVEAGLAGSYPDAVVSKERIDAGHIAVRTAVRLSASVAEGLDLYGL